MFIAGSPSQPIPPTLCRLFALFCLLGAVRLLASVFVPAWRPRQRWRAPRGLPGPAVPLSAWACAGMVPFQLALGLLALTEAGDLPAWRPWRAGAMGLGDGLLAAALLHEWFRSRDQVAPPVQASPAREGTPAAGDAGSAADAPPPP